MYAKVSDLPALVQTQLKRRGYHGKDIEVRAKEKVGLQVGGWDGKRGYTDIINLDSGSVQCHTGSWGGANPFNPTNRVDLDERQYTIPPNAVVIQGYEGYKPMASCYCSAETLQPMLPAGPEVTEEEKEVLSWFLTYKASYRKPMVDAKPIGMINSLVARKLLKRNKAGALSITVEGKNAARG